MNSSFQPLLLTLTLAAGTLLAGCASTATPDRKVDPTAITMIPLSPAAPANPPPPTIVISSDNSAPPVATGEDFYRILAGDTGTRIARKYHLTVSDLLALNPGVQWNRLRVGQQIRVRAAR